MPSSFRTALCVAAGLVLLSGCGGAQSRFDSHFQRGRQYFEKGNLEKAGIEFRNALQIRAKDPDALYYAGRIAEQKADIRNAVGFYLAAIDARTDFPAARARLGRIYVFAAVPKKALEVVAPGLTEHPQDPDLLAAHELKDDVAAMADAEQAVKVAPGNENAAAILAALYTDKQDFQGAVAVVSRALQLTPGSVDLHEVLTNIYLRSGQSAEAMAQMHEIIGLKPDELAPRAQLAAYLRRQHKLDEAQKVLEDSVQHFSAGKSARDANQAKLLLVSFISAERSGAAGEKLLRDYIARQPDDDELLFGLAALLQKSNDLQAAMAVYQDIIKREGLSPQGLMARTRSAALLVAQNKQAEAAKLIGQVLEKSPRDDDALILRANIAMENHDPTAAVADLRIVLNDQPRSVSLQQLIARAYLEKGEPGLAEEALHSALAVAPDDVTTRIQLARLLDQSGRGEQAVTMLQEGVTRVPKSVPLRSALIQMSLARRDAASARQAAAELKAIAPQSPLGPYFAGLADFQLGHLDDSRKELEEAFAAKPDDPEILRALVNVDTASKKPERAVARVQAVVDRSPQDAFALNLLGELHARAKDYEHASADFTRSSAAAPKWWLPYRNLAQLRVAAGDPEGAAGEYEAALKAAPLVAPLVVDAAQLFEKQGHVDQAIAAYEMLYKGNLEARQLAANNLAMLLATYKTDDASLKRALELTSSFTTTNSSSLLDTGGWVRFKRGEYREALPILERANAAAPDSRVIRYHLAMAELRLGMKARARSHLESALQGGSDFSEQADARSALASLMASTG
jgi:tetratricopeptide (TPR) repeat protein